MDASGSIKACHRAAVRLKILETGGSFDGLSLSAQPPAYSL